MVFVKKFRKKKDKIMITGFSFPKTGPHRKNCEASCETHLDATAAACTTNTLKDERHAPASRWSYLSHLGPFQVLMHRIESTDKQTELNIIVVCHIISAHLIKQCSKNRRQKKPMLLTQRCKTKQSRQWRNYCGMRKDVWSREVSAR